MSSIECKCGLPLMSHTSWTPSNPARRFVCCPNRYKTGVRKCTVWDWCDPELDNEWYKAHLYEMYKNCSVKTLRDSILK